nr:hypothetical protein Iba_chr15bCG5680 [Ipomoea batatas]
MAKSLHQRSLHCTSNPTVSPSLLLHRSWRWSKINISWPAWRPSAGARSVIGDGLLPTPWPPYIPAIFQIRCNAGRNWLIGSWDRGGECSPWSGSSRGFLGSLLAAVALAWVSPEKASPALERKKLTCAVVV